MQSVLRLSTEVLVYVYSILHQIYDYSIVSYSNMPSSRALLAYIYIYHAHTNGSLHRSTVLIGTEVWGTVIVLCYYVMGDCYCAIHAYTHL